MSKLNMSLVEELEFLYNRAIEEKRNKRKEEIDKIYQEITKRLKETASKGNKNLSIKEDFADAIMKNFDVLRDIAKNDNIIIEYNTHMGVVNVTWKSKKC